MQNAQRRPIVYDIIPPALAADLVLTTLDNGQVGHLLKIETVNKHYQLRSDMQIARLAAIDSLENALNEVDLASTELANYGVTLHLYKPAVKTLIQPVAEPVVMVKKQIAAGKSMARPTPKSLVENLPYLVSSPRRFKGINLASRIQPLKKPRTALRPVLLILVLAVLTSSALGVWRVTTQTITNAESAFANAQSALANLREFKFREAAGDFETAHRQLMTMNGFFNNLGASMLATVRWVPGAQTIGSANSILRASEKLAQAGALVSGSLAEVHETNLIKAISKPGGSATRPPLQILADLQKTLHQANADIIEARSLLAGADLSAVPVDRQPLIEQLKERLPTLVSYTQQAVQASDVVATILGAKGRRSYMLLFVNNSELRPVGGFPGSFAIITFENGYMISMRVDDVYNVDGQLKEKIIPPPELQHITPLLGMRDVGWFGDFATSARKISEYYRKDTTETVDGVIAVTPDVVADLLNISGPIPMPEYGLVLTGDNFLAQVQDTVEYRGDRSQPKKILKDFQPLFLQKLQAQTSAQWYQSAAILLNAIKSKHILAYFNDSEPQRFAESLNAAGRVNFGTDDYLAVYFTNIKGFKTDAVTDNDYNLKIRIDERSVHHELVITRTHNGQDRSEPFYNRPNTSYVRVYAPRGSLLKHVAGDSLVSRKALLDYSVNNYVVDSDIAALQNSMTHPLEGIDQFEDAGATVFGFWLVTEPGKSQSVTIQYDTPALSGYALNWQKQPGTGNDTAQLNISTNRDIKTATGLMINGSGGQWAGTLSTDKNFKLEF